MLEKRTSQKCKAPVKYSNKLCVCVCVFVFNNFLVSTFIRDDIVELFQNKEDGVPFECLAENRLLTNTSKIAAYPTDKTCVEKKI